MKPESFTVTLAGTDYACPPLTLGQSRAVRVGVLRDQAKAPAPFADPDNPTPDELADRIEYNHDYDLSLVSIALRHAYPEMTREKISDISGLTYEELDVAATKILNASGWGVKSGEGQAPVPLQE